MINSSDPVLAAINTVDAEAMARLHDQLAAAAETDRLLDVGYRTVDSPVGTLLLAATDQGLVRVAYDREDHDHVLQGLSDQISPRILRAPRRLDQVARQLAEYFAGKRRDFVLPLDFRLTRGFRRAVLGHLVLINYGHTESVRRGRRSDRSGTSGEGSRHCLRYQSDASGRAVPPGAAQRREARRLHRWAGGQGGSALAGVRQDQSTEIHCHAKRLAPARSGARV